MLAVSFDTLKFANRLKLVGVDSKQAEAEAEIFSEIFEVNLRALATKDDLEQLKKEMDVKFEMLRKEMDGRFSVMNAELSSMKWLLRVGIAGTFGLLAKAFLG